MKRSIETTLWGDVMPITYNASSNIITVTDFPEDSPCTFEDIYQADLASGWGVVQKQGDAQYLFDCRLQIGDGASETWFCDALKQVTFSASSTSGSEQKLFDIRANGHLRLGVCTSDVEKTTEDGCSLVYLGTNNPYFVDSVEPVEIYSCMFASPNYYARFRCPAGSKIYNTIFAKGVYLVSVHGVLHNIMVQHGAYGMTDPYVEEGSERVRIENATIGLFIRSGATFRNVDVLKATYDVRVFFSHADSYLINTRCNWVFQWLGSSTGKVYRQYTFKLRALDESGNPVSGATVEVRDKNGDLQLSATTDDNGEYPRASLLEDTMTKAVVVH